MSDTTYPDGPYLFTGKDQFGWPHKDRIALLDNGTLQFVGADWLCVLRHCDIDEFVPLVPSTELDAAHQRIAELDAEVEQMRAERTLDEMLQDLRRRYGSYVHLSANYNNHWWVAWGVLPQNRTGYYLVPSEAIRAAWEAVCKEEA